MPDHMALLSISVLAVAFGAGFVALARANRNRWIACNAVLVSSESRDADWDLLRVQFSALEQRVTATVAVPSEMSRRLRAEGSVPIRYNPTAPEQACLASARGKLHIVGVFLLSVGVIAFVSALVMKSAT